MKKKSNNDKNPSNKDYFSGLEKFLHEPLRLQIIAQLYSLEQEDMMHLKKTLGVTWGNLSFHSSKLEEMGYISIQKQFIGKKSYTLLKITKIGTQKFEEYKNAMIKFLS